MLQITLIILWCSLWGMKNISIMIYISCDHAESWTTLVGIIVVQQTDWVKLPGVYTQGLSHFIHDHYDSWCDIVQEFIKWVSKNAVDTLKCMTLHSHHGVINSLDFHAQKYHDWWQILLCILGPWTSLHSTQALSSTPYLHVQGRYSSSQEA